jgi:hypothetical protein
MEHARKFVLLPQESASRFGVSPHPHKVQSDVVSTHMGRMLDRKDLSNDQKVTSFNQAHQRFLIHKQYLDQPLKFSIESERENKPQDVLHAAVNLFQLTEGRKQKAENLAKYLNIVEGLDWNSRGEISVRGQTIPSSSLTALMIDVLNPSAGYKPVGSDQFAELLKQTRLPPNIIGDVSGRYAGPRTPKTPRYQQLMTPPPSSAKSAYQPSTSGKSYPGALRKGSEKFQRMKKEHNITDASRALFANQEGYQTRRRTNQPPTLHAFSGDDDIAEEGEEEEEGEDGDGGERYHDVSEYPDTDDDDYRGPFDLSGKGVRRLLRNHSPSSSASGRGWEDY